MLWAEFLSLCSWRETLGSAVLVLHDTTVLKFNGDREGLGRIHQADGARRCENVTCSSQPGLIRSTHEETRDRLASSHVAD